MSLLPNTLATVSPLFCPCLAWAQNNRLLQSPQLKMALAGKINRLAPKLLFQRHSSSSSESRISILIHNKCCVRRCPKIFPRFITWWWYSEGITLWNIECLTERFMLANLKTGFTGCMLPNKDCNWIFFMVHQTGDIWNSHRQIPKAHMFLHTTPKRNKDP